MKYSQYSGILVLGIVISVIPPVYSNNARDITSSDGTVLINHFFKTLYNFSFHEADSIVLVMKRSDMDEATIHNVEANLSWWKLLSGDSTEDNFKHCDNNLDESIRLLLKSNRDDTEADLNLIYAYSLKARLENYNGNTLKSLVSFYKSSTYIKKCINRQYRDEKFYLVLGLYLYLIDYVEHEYYMANALFISFPAGDKIKGLKYLEDCSASTDEMIRTETNYFLLKIYAYLEKDYSKAYEKVQILTMQHSNNLVYKIEQLKLLFLLKKTEEAQLYQKSMIEEITGAGYINSEQKNHFISQIEQLKKINLKN